MTKIREVHYPHALWPVVRYVRRKRQKYIRIRVTDERITVSGPWYSSHSEMEQFLKEKKGWIDTTLGKINRKIKKINAVREENENSILLRGTWKPLEHLPVGSQDKWQLTERQDRILFTTPDGYNRMPEPDVVYKFYRRLADTEIRQRVMQVSAALPFSYKKVFIRSQKTKWGTCSSKGNLSFNWRLIKCPLFVWDYLIVHELCHTVHMNHSREFWLLVKECYPDYLKAKQWIREHGELVFSDP